MIHHPSKLRRQITWEAARLLLERRESDQHQAKLRAARKICRGWVRPEDLPTSTEIYDELQVLSRLHDVHGSSEPDPVEAPSLEELFASYEALLLPLENVKLSPKRHPEGDALYHSLQVFDLARDELPYDEEFLLAALLHDVGKAIDPTDSVGAALETLAGIVTERTLWFIEHHHEAQAVLDKTIGARAHRRLRESEDYDELMLLARCDRAGRQRGVPTSDLREALDYLLDLAITNG